MYIGTIVLAADPPASEHFAKWLSEIGHTVQIRRVDRPRILLAPIPQRAVAVLALRAGRHGSALKELARRSRVPFIPLPPSRAEAEPILIRVGLVPPAAEPAPVPSEPQYQTVEPAPAAPESPGAEPPPEVAPPREATPATAPETAAAITPLVHRPLDYALATRNRIHDYKIARLRELLGKQPHMANAVIHERIRREFGQGVANIAISRVRREIMAAVHPGIMAAVHPGPPALDSRSTETDLPAGLRAAIDLCKDELRGSAVVRLTFVREQDGTYRAQIRRPITVTRSEEV